MTSPVRKFVPDRVHTGTLLAATDLATPSDTAYHYALTALLSVEACALLVTVAAQTAVQMS